MYLKDGVLYIKTENGFVEATPMLTESGAFCAHVKAAGKVLNKRPVGAKPVLQSEVIAQLGLVPGQEHSAVTNSGDAPAKDEDDVPLTKNEAQHPQPQPAQPSKSGK